MTYFWNNFFFGYLPYIALAVLIFGVLARFKWGNKTIHATSTEFLDRSSSLQWGSMLFHYGIILVFFGHFFGLLTPQWLYEIFMTVETKRILAISLGATSGFVALFGLILLLSRRLRNKNIYANSTFQDIYIVILLIIQITLGLLCTIETSRSPISTYLSLDYWAQGLVLFEPIAWKYIVGIPLIYKLHIINGFFIFLLFPYSKLIHFLVAPLNYFFRRGKQIVWKKP